MFAYFSMWCMRSDSTDNGTCMFVICLLCHSLTCCVAFHRHAYFHLLSNVPYFLLFVLVKCLINIKSKVELLLACSFILLSARGLLVVRVWLLFSLSKNTMSVQWVTLSFR